MRNLILGVLVLLSVNVYAQEGQDKELSNADKFSNKSGTLIKKVFKDIGSVADVNLKILTINYILEEKEMKSLRFEYEYKGSYTDTKIGSIDSDELEGLIKSIKYINENIVVDEPQNYTEVSFKSRSGFEAGCFWYVGRSKGQWRMYVKLEKYDSKSSVFMYSDEFDKLLALLENAKTMM